MICTYGASRCSISPSCVTAYCLLSRHAGRCPASPPDKAARYLDEHAVVKRPPRGGKTGWLASVILHYPGPVLSTTTKHDVFELTSGIRARRGPSTSSTPSTSVTCHRPS